MANVVSDASVFPILPVTGPRTAPESSPLDGEPGAFAKLLDERPASEAPARTRDRSDSAPAKDRRGVEARDKAPEKDEAPQPAASQGKSGETAPDAKTQTPQETKEAASETAVPESDAAETPDATILTNAAADLPLPAATAAVAATPAPPVVAAMPPDALPAAAEPTAPAAEAAGDAPAAPTPAAPQAASPADATVATPANGAPALAAQAAAAQAQAPADGDEPDAGSFKAAVAAAETPAQEADEPEQPATLAKAAAERAAPAKPAATAQTTPAGDAASMKSGPDPVQNLTMATPLQHAAPAQNTAAAQAPAAAAPTPLPAHTVPVLAVEIAAHAFAGKNRFEIRLDPPELGRIDVRLEIDRDGQVKSRLIVERAETLDMLRRDAPQLERALQQAGLKTTDNALEFSLRHHEQQHQDEARPDAGRLVVHDDGAPPDAVPHHYGRLLGLGGGLDIRV